MSHMQKTRFCQILFNEYFEELTNRSISNIRSFFLNVKESRMVGWTSKRTSKRYRVRKIESKQMHSIR